MYALVHADDIPAVGVVGGFEKLRKTLGENFIIKDIGDLNTEGSKLEFLGRTLTRNGDEVRLKGPSNCTHGFWRSYI